MDLLIRHRDAADLYHEALATLEDETKPLRVRTAAYQLRESVTELERSAGVARKRGINDVIEEFRQAWKRAADRRLASAGFGAWRVASGRIAAALALGVVVSVVAYLTLLLRSGVEHPPHAAIAILIFAAIYIGIGALIGVLVKGPLEGSLLVVLVWALDVFSGPAMTSSGGIANFTPTREAAELLIAAGGGQDSPASDWMGAAAVAVGGIAVALVAFWLSARSKG